MKVVAAVAVVAVAPAAVGPDRRQELSRVNCCDIVRENDCRVTRMSDAYCW